MATELNRPSGDAAIAEPDLLSQRERFFFDGYRLLEAAALCALTFGPLADRIVDLPSPLIARGASLAYLLAAIVIFLVGRAIKGEARAVVFLGLLIDVLVAITAVFAIDGFESQIAALLLVNVSCGALLLPPRLAFPFAVLASIALIGSFGTGGGRDAWSSASLYALSYLAATVLCQIIRRSMLETRKLAVQREVDLANLTQMNDLIIRRMRTGVMVVDGANQVHRINESAWHLLGNPSPNRKDLGDIAPELSRRLYHWRTSGKSETAPAALAEGVPEVIPRFVRLAQSDTSPDAQHVLIFLDDISLLSRQAEQLTLSSLGRLSASIAHEVRNPLTAISYSAQLLAESEDLPEPDHRLVDIIRLQCSRMNAIVENILQLSRRERSRPEAIDLNQFVTNFVDEFRNVQPLEQDELRAVATTRGLTATIDPGHLQQIVWNLVQNALRYGRLPHEPARVSVIARRLSDAGPTVVEVVDRGPGIPKRVADQIFDPFFTTNEHGTGLGLYIARQLCEANQATLEYVPVAGGGSCFRVVLPAPAPIGGAAPLRTRSSA